MAKVNGVHGKATGKIGSLVYAINRGQQIVREYNGNVANPNTTGQQTTRSKFKLMSQLSSVMAPVIAIKKEGMVSARNMFSKINFPACAYAGGAVSIKLNRVKLTNSNRSLGAFTADRSSGTEIAVVLKNDMSAYVDKVVYCLFEQQVNGDLLLKDSAVVETAGVDGKFAGALVPSTASVAIYAYGIKINETGADALFGNMVAPSAESVAKLLVTNSEVAAGTTITDTLGLVIREGEDTGDSDDIDQITVSCTVSGNGSVTGAGRYAIGQQVTLTATPDAEASFVAWKLGSPTGTTVSTNPVYTFEAAGDIVLCAVFQGGPTPHYTIAANVDPAGAGTVSGAGSYEEGASCTLVATPASGKIFGGWFENGSLVSNNSTLTFTVTAARTLTAEFGDEPESGFSNVTVNNNNWNQNMQGANTEVTMAADYVGEATKGGLYYGNVSVGDTITDSSNKMVAVSNGHLEYGGNGKTVSAGINYLIAVKPATGGGANEYEVVEIYPYTYNAIEE